MDLSTLNSVLIVVVSFLCGFACEIGYLKIKGRRIIVPFVSASSRNVTIAGIALALVSIGTVLNVEHAQEETESCNREFRAALKYNTDVNNEQRELNEQSTTIAVERRELLDATFKDISLALGDSERVKAAVDSYVIDAGALSKDYDAVVAHRESLNNDRKPYPEPTCGNNS